MKNLILVLGLIFFFPLYASANYLKISAGIYSDTTFDFSGANLDLKSKLPFPVYVGLGFGNKKLYLEIEASMHQAEEPDVPSPESVVIYSAGLNLILDFADFKSKLNPFIGAGAAAAFYTPDSGEDAYGVNKHFFVGLNYSLTTHFSLGLEARHTSSIIDPDFGDDLTPAEAKYKQVSYLLSTRFRY